MKLQHVNDIGFERIILERVGVTAIAFLSYGSVACDHFRPELHFLAEKLDSRVVVLWIDVDENPSLTKELGVEAVPTTLLFRNGDEIAKYEGPYSREMLAERMMALL